MKLGTYAYYIISMTTTCFHDDRILFEETSDDYLIITSSLLKLANCGGETCYTYEGCWNLETTGTMYWCQKLAWRRTNYKHCDETTFIHFAHACSLFLWAVVVARKSKWIRRCQSRSLSRPGTGKTQVLTPEIHPSTLWFFWWRHFRRHSVKSVPLTYV